MYNGMMDPELIRLAQEQMSRMSPAEFARIQQQMMSNPELLRMASESMKNLRPEDLKHAAEQLKHTRPEDMAEFGEKIANATPEELAAMRARVDAQTSYEINAAEMLKKQGNELHRQGRFNEATQKYLLAKKNLQGILSTKGSSLMLACSLNLMSCYLKTSRFDECIREGTEVLAQDGKNVKALYRRGQAFKELGQLEDAVSDLSKALEVSPDDETIAVVLRDTREMLMKGGSNSSRGLVIEEITEDKSETCESLNTEYSVSQQLEAGSCSKSKRKIPSEVPSTNSECLKALKDDPGSVRSFQNFISHADSGTLTALSGGKGEGISPDMVKTASNVLGKMSSDELQKMLHTASSYQGENPFLKRGSLTPNSSNSGLVPPEMTTDMLKMASDFMSKMSPAELQKMFEMASTLKGKDTVSEAAILHANGSRSNNDTIDTRENFAVNGGDNSGASSSFQPSSTQSGFPSSSADLQEQMRSKMKDPAMWQMFSSMIKNMSPEMMANMSEQFGVKLSLDDAEKAQQAMSSLSPEDLDRMIKWADRIQSGIQGAKNTKNWLLGRPGMILAVLMLILAFIFRWLGYIG